MTVHPEGRLWLESLPARVDACVGQWNLKVGSPFPTAYVSIPFEATLPDGTEAVLKMQFPHPESDHEADALRVWNGEGAVRLLDQDSENHALLIERCRPGRPLSEAGQTRALDVLISLLPRLWSPVAAPFRTLAEEAGRWADELDERWEKSGRPFERKLIDLTREALRSLSKRRTENLLLHQDLHGGNVLSSGREPWLVIDPKPLAGEREFSVAPIIRSFELGAERKNVIYRFDRLTAELGLDRERSRLWTIAQSVAWGLGSQIFQSHVRTVRWMAEGL